MSGNTTTVVGNLTRDPEVKYTKNGKAYCRFSVAHNHRWRNNQTQEWDEKVSFVDAIAWGSTAENLADSLGKGDRVIVLGRLDLEQWETDQGEKRSKLAIVAEAVAADLQFATVEATKNESGGSSSRPSRSSGGGTSARRASRRQEPEDEYGEEEEPF